MSCQDTKTFRIWWSPVGYPNGHATIQAKDKIHAVAQAREEMRKRSMLGAYGADEEKNDE